MTLTPGTRLGPYEILGPLGSGGMGEVFKARDTRLERSVAIKVLPAEFAQNAQLRQRLEREAKSISQLTHPNICTLYDIGRQDGVEFLVMEYLEGETLADRLQKGPLPLELVIRYGIQIAEALERAHKAGIVHRDLKPGNVMLTRSGAKLLDFGLAKESDQPVLSALTSLRTERKSLTEEGAIVGTFQYMAPEQIEGGAIDARTDIFALGALLYEMTTGRKAFEGKSKASLIASILTAEPPPISAVQPLTPAALDRLVRSCLAKDPDARMQSAHDVALELRWIEESQTTTPRPHSKRDRLGWVVAAVLAIAALATGGMLWRNGIAQQNRRLVRTVILPPDKTSFDFLTAGAPPAISPDGTKIVFGAVEAGKTRSLWVRPLDSFVAQQLAGTEGASFPFWSPDGRYIAFFADNVLKKVEVSGGAAVVLCNVVDGRGGSWSPDGQTIIFAGRYTPILRVPAAGGRPVEVTTFDGGEGTHRWPEFLPDSRHFLYVGAATGNENRANMINVGSIDGKTRKPLVTATDEAHYVDGFLLFVRDRILTAQAFDLKALAVKGEAFPLNEQQVETTPLFGRSIVSVSAGGTLVYQTGAGTQTTQLTWFDRGGKVLGVIGEPGPYLGAVMAPDEKQVLTFFTLPNESNIWAFDLVRGVRSRITFNSATDGHPIWSPDGQKMIYTSLKGGHFRFLLRNLATGSEEVLRESDAPGVPAVTSWSADGQRILYTEGGRTTRGDIWWMSLADRKPHLYIGTPFLENGGRLSPDGKWVAYFSNETGTNEVYVAPFPPTGARWQVSSGGGIVPRWRSDGRELFYVVSGSPPAMMAVPIAMGATPEVGRAVKLFGMRAGPASVTMYDVTRDGRRFVVNCLVGDQPPPAPLYVVQHFDRELRAAVEHRE